MVAADVGLCSVILAGRTRLRNDHLGGRPFLDIRVRQSGAPSLHGVMDTFPRERPQQMNADEMEQTMLELGPDTPGEKFDQLIAGVKPPENATIDVARFDDALDAYSKAVTAFDAFTAKGRRISTISSPCQGRCSRFCGRFRVRFARAAAGSSTAAGRWSDRSCNITTT